MVSLQLEHLRLRGLDCRVNDPNGGPMAPTRLRDAVIHNRDEPK